MKFIRSLSTLLLLAFVVSPALAQRIKIAEGSLDALKGETKIDVEFTYEHLKVGKFDNEDDYISKKTEEYNKKEAGRGDAWAKSWKNDRPSRYEPKFKELFNDNGVLQAGNFKKTKYVLLFKTLFLEPGFNVGVMRKNAEMDAEVWIVDAANRGNVIAKITVDNAKGRIFGGFDFDTGVRIAESYADAGKALAKFIKKETK